MPTSIWLTNEQSDIAGYLRAKVGERSDSSSLIRSVTATVNGPTTGVPITRNTSLGSQLFWITDPVNGTDLTASAWEMHLWAMESNANANAALRLQVLRFTSSESSTVLDDVSVELSTVTRDIAQSSVAATATELNEGDRLVIKLLVDDAPSLVTGYTVTVSFNGFFARSEGDTYVICPDVLVLTTAVPIATIAEIRQLLQDKSETHPMLTDGDIELAFEQAVGEYSMVKPYTAMQYYSGDGSTYQFTLPRLWVNGLSDIVSVEYPAGQSPKSMLIKEDDWGISDGWLGVQPTKNVWITLVPQAGTDNILIAYTTNHLHNTDVTTIPQLDYQAVLWLATSHSARMLSAGSAGHTDSTIIADSNNYRDESSRWKDVALQYWTLYSNHVLQPVFSEATASGRSDWDTYATDRRDYLWHRRRFR